MIPRLQTEQELEDPYAADEEYLREVIAQASAPSPAPAPAPAPAAAPDWMSALQATKPGWMLQAQQTQPVSAETGEAPGPIEQYLFYDPTQTAVGQQYQRYSPTGEFQGTGQFKGVGNALDLALQAGQDLGPFVQFIPGVGQVFQAINAVGALKSGNIAQGIGTLAGLGGYTDIANAARLVGAIENKDLLGLATAGMNLTGTKDIGGFTTKDITAANAVVQGLQTGNVAQALNGAAQLTDSPNVALAGAAVGMLDAAKSGNPAAMLKAGEALSGAINNAQNQAAITQAYQDPSRQLDTVLGGDIRDAGLSTKVGAEDLTTQDLVDIVNPPGEAAATPTTTAPATAAAPTNTTATTQTETATTAPVDTSGLPAFNKATITTLPQSRAAEIIAEMYSGQSLDWVNQGVLNAAASHIRADDEAGLRARLASGQVLGTGDAISGDVAVDYRAPAGTRVAQPGENAGILGYTETGTPVNLIEQLGTTAKKMTPEEAFAYDMANAGTAIDPLTGQPYELDTSENARAIADVIRGIPSALGAGAGEQIKLLGVAGGWLTGNKENALTQIGSNVESWANSITPDSVKQGQDAISKQISEADGLPAKAWAAVKGAATNPLATLHWIGKEAIQEVLPLGSAIAVGRTVSNATKLKFGEDLAQRYGLTAAIGTDATMNAGESATASYEQVYNTLRDKGVSVENASSAAAAAAAGSGLVTLFTAAIGDAALVNKLMNNVKGATLNATLREGPTEFAEGALQSVAEQNAVNVALGRGLVFDSNEALTSGTLEALIGAGTTGTIAKGADIFTPTEADVTSAPTPPAAATTTTTAPTTAAPAAVGQTKVEPTFDPNTVVATDPDTGDAVTLGDLTRQTTVSTDSRVEPTLGLTEDTGVDSQQTINDYINEVLGGTTPATTDASANVVVGTDPDTGADVTLGDLGLSGSSAAAPATTVPATTTAAPTDASANVVVGTDPDTGADVTLADLGLSGPPSTAGTTVSSDTTLATNAQGDTLTAADVGAATSPATAAATDATATTAPATGAATGTETTTDPNTGVETATATNPNTGTTTTTQTDANTNTSVTTNANPNTNTTTSTATDANTNTSTTTATDANTNTTTTTDTNPNTGVTTQTESNPNTNTSTTTTTDANTGVTTQTDTNNNTNTTTQTDTNPSTNTTTTTETNANTGVETNTQTDTNTGVTTQTETNPNTNTTTTTETNPNTNTTTTTETNTNTNTTVTTETNTNTGVSTTTTVDTTTGKVINTNVDEPLPLGEDVLPPVTEEELREIVSGPPPAPTPPASTPPTPAPTPAPPAPTPAPPAPTPAPPAPTVKPPVVKPPSPAPSPAAQLAQVPGMTPELAKFIQELMQTEEADLLQLTTALKAEREEKREGLRGKLKSRKA